GRRHTSFSRDWGSDVCSSALAAPAPVAASGDVVVLRLERGDAREERRVREGAAFAWEGYRVAVVAIYGPGELGAGLVALEVATRSEERRVGTSGRTWEGTVER